ncbi:class I SAM-dependent methyltransferase [Alkalibacter mobilis]|uniref:class I SAM-dependent methyltransferase n=1 Tax=Alkalibacter mobilis TaxID=2787712 RepID=UPI0018A0EB52|nr:class I SAM-dependent methyltransferase [Alkalibacter mobilis]MBF7097741.1 class I SAM-dependent methyltransferase [Alkalibacter mobilis]
MPKTKCFDENYMDYEEWFDKNRYVYLSELKAVKHFVPQIGTGLEVGVGSGKFAVPLGIKIGLEPSEKMKQLAESKGVKVYGGVAEALPFEDSSFDFVLMVTTICFVDDVDKSLREVKRVLKKNGKFIIGLVDSESPLGKIYKEKKDGSVFYKDAIFYSAK